MCPGTSVVGARCVAATVGGAQQDIFTFLYRREKFAFLEELERTLARDRFAQRHELWPTARLKMAVGLTAKDMK